MSGELEIVDPCGREDWDALIASHPDGSIFHSAAWARVLQETYGYGPAYLVAFQDAKPVGLLPLMDVNSRLTGRRGVSLPFSDFCEPLTSGTCSLEDLVDRALEHGRACGWRSLELRAGRRALDGVPASGEYVGHTVSLAASEEDLFAGLKGTVRTAIRKARQSELVCETADTMDAVREFYHLNRLTRRAHGLPPQPFTFFENLHRHVLSQGLGGVVLARRGGKAVAGAVFFLFGEQALFKFGASDAREQSLRGNDLVMWEGMRWLASKGASVLLLGKTRTQNEGLRRFKAGFGGEEHAIRYYKYDLEEDRYVTERDWVQGWHNRFFRYMPLPLSRAVGGVLYRHMG